MDNETAVFFDWNSSVGEPNDQEDDFCIRLYKNTLTMGTWLCHDANQYLCEGLLSLSLSLSLSQSINESVADIFCKAFVSITTYICIV